MALLDEIGAYLATQGRGSLGSTLFLGLLPADPDVVVTVYEYAGMAPTHTMANTTPIENPRVQVVCRHTSYASAKSAAQAIWNDLNQGGATVGGHAYFALNPLQSPFLLSRDEKNRVLVAANYEVIRSYP